MTVTTQHCIIAAQGNGATTVFPFDFIIPTSEDVLVYLQDAETRETVETLTEADYTIIGLNEADGGTVTYTGETGPLTADFYIVIERVVPYTQTVTISPTGGFNQAAVMGGLDNLELQIQQVKEKGDRAIISAYGAPQYSFGDDIEEGDTLLMGEGNVIIAGPTGDQIANAQYYAEVAEAAAMGLTGREAYCTSIAQIAALDIGAINVALLSIADGAAQSEFTSKFIWREDKDYTDLVAEDPLHLRYIESDSAFPDEGCWVAEQFPTAPIIDNTSPLNYSNFYRAYGKDHNAAMLAIFDAALNTGSVDYRFFLDFEGSNIFLEEPVAPTGGANQLWFMQNARFAAANTWSGDHMLDFRGTGGTSSFRFDNCIFDGKELAHWVTSDAVGLTFNSTHFLNNRDDDTPGLNMLDNAHIKLDFCRLSTPDGAINPNVRNRVGLYCEKGDQKVWGCVVNYFHYGMIFAGFGNTIGNCHIYQGTGEASGSFSAGVKFTGGRSGSIMTNTYIDKCFIELSNETKDTDLDIGDFISIGVHTALDCTDSAFAFYVVRDYGRHSGTCTVSDVVIRGGEYRNADATVVNLTRLWNPSAFDTNSFGFIKVDGNIFTRCNPEWSEPTLKKNFTAATTHTFDFSDVVPFNADLWSVNNVIGKPSSGGGQALDIGVITPSAKTCRIDTATNWAGDMTVTASINKADADGFISK